MQYIGGVLQVLVITIFGLIAEIIQNKYPITIMSSLVGAIMCWMYVFLIGKINVYNTIGQVYVP